MAWGNTGTTPTGTGKGILSMIDVMALTPQDLERFIHMQGIVARQENNAARVRALREYYAGEHPIMLTKRQQEYLGELVEGESFTFAHNLVRSIIDTLRERLDVSGFTVNGQGVEGCRPRRATGRRRTTSGAHVGLVDGRQARQRTDNALSPRCGMGKRM